MTVGISKYQDPNIRLISPAEDARAISRVFEKTGKNLYGKIKFYQLIDKEATREKIITRMQDLAKSANRIDTVILFFAGHGDTDQGIYYFLPFNADITDLKKSGLAIGEISAFIQKLPVNKIVVLFDTCKSGKAAAAIGGIALERGFEDRKIIASLAKERGIIVFSASNASQAAYEIKKLGHGIFTYSIIDALENRKSEIANGRLISIVKLLSTVNRLTRKIAEDYLGLEQSPILYMFGEDFGIGLN
jgi:uncharacterized caspase-like protein